MIAVKKPIPVCVWQLDHEIYPDAVWVREAMQDGTLYYEDHRWHIATYEGIMIAFDGDYLIRGVEGEIYPCRESVFENTYKIVEE